MIAIAKKTRHKTTPTWHTQFLPMMPAVVAYARVAFRKLRADAREDMVQEVLANALVAFERLVKLGNGDLAFVSVLARYGVVQARCGRRVGSSLNSNDVASTYAQWRRNFTVERLDDPVFRNGGWLEIAVEDRTASPADTAALRINFQDWLRRLPAKQRRIAKRLATGERPSVAAKRFYITAGRISQVRRELQDSWDEFQRPADDRAA